MEAKSLPDAFDVYLHCREFLWGKRKQRKVARLLTRNEKSIARLTCDFTIPAIASVAASLLKDGIFESPHLAIQRFPELATPSAAQAVERASPQADSPASEVEAARNVDPKDVNGERTGEWTDKAQDDAEGDEDASTSPAGRILKRRAIPELQPVYLPFKTQHILLTALQRMLEDCCFNFGHRWVPELMKSKGWLEVDSLELTQWIQWFPKANKCLPAATLRHIEGKSVTEILSAVGVIRHAAVHRVRMSSEDILDMLGAAETFANMLYNDANMTAIQQIKINLNGKVEEFWRNGTMMRRKLTKRLGDVARCRLEMDKMEEGWIEDYQVMDEKHRNEAGAAIEEYLEKFQKSSENLNEPEKRESYHALESVNLDGDMQGFFNAAFQ